MNNLPNIKNFTMIIGLPGSGKTALAEALLMDSAIIVDDPSVGGFDLLKEPYYEEYNHIIITDPMLIRTTPEEAERRLRERFPSYECRFLWVYFENNQKAAWKNVLDRNDGRVISESFHKELSNRYVIPSNVKTIPVYQKEKRTGMCEGCPLAFTELSEKAQSYGCLPSPFDIYKLKVDHNLNWHCHEDDNKPCVGYIQYAKEKGLDYKSGEPATYTQWDNGELPM